MTPRLTVDGEIATLEDLSHQARVNYGAYTSFAVQDGGVRGLDLHMSRLETEALELFGTAVDEDRLRAFMRGALGSSRDGWMRVSLFSRGMSPRTPDWRGRPQVMIGVSAPVAPVAQTVRLQIQPHQRAVPHLKHAATFDLIRARRIASDAGFDDALFVSGEGRVSEGSLWNIGFLDGDTIVWPDAPMLDGVTQRLIKRGLDVVGLEQRTEVVRADDLTRFDGAFISNSATPACAVAAIGERVFAPNPDQIDRVAEAWRMQPSERL